MNKEGLAQKVIHKLSNQDYFSFINDLVRENFDMFKIRMSGDAVEAVAFKTPENNKISINFQLKEIWDYKEEPIKYKDITELKQLVKDRQFHVVY